MGASMSEVNLCFLFTLSSYDCFPLKFSLLLPQLTQKIESQLPIVFPCLLSMCGHDLPMSLYLFLLIPKLPFNCSYLFFPKHVARFCTLTLTFPKYWPSLRQPYLHHLQVFDLCQFCTLPSMPASVHNGQAASCPEGFSFMYPLSPPVEPASSKYPCLFPPGNMPCV